MSRKRQKSKRTNSLRQMKHIKVYSDLLEALERKALIALGSQQEGALFLFPRNHTAERNNVKTCIASVLTRD